MDETFKKITELNLLYFNALNKHGHFETATFKYSKETDLLNIKFSETQKVAYSRGEGDNFIYDFNKKGQLIGMSIIAFSQLKDSDL